MKIAKQVEICVQAGAWTLKPDWPERAVHALEIRGYADASAKEGHVQGSGGSDIGAMHFFPCDPRRRHHTIIMDVDTVTYKVDTGFCLFTDADEAVVRAEAGTLLAELAGTPPNTAELAEMESQRAAKDRNVILMIAGAAVIIVALAGYLMFK